MQIFRFLGRIFPRITILAANTRRISSESKTGKWESGEPKRRVTGEVDLPKQNGPARELEVQQAGPPRSAQIVGKISDQRRNISCISFPQVDLFYKRISAIFSNFAS
jgi:hypothetical protein